VQLPGHIAKGRNVNEHLVLAERRSRRVAAVLHRGGLEYLDPPEEVRSSGTASTRRPVLSDASGGEEQLFFTTGILQSLKEDRLA
jgi:hypothetical protein